MSEDQKLGTPSEDALPDPIKNLKAETERKLGNMTSAFESMKAQNDAIMAQLRELTSKTSYTKPTQVEQPEESIRELLYDNPDAAAKRIEERAEKRILSKLESTRAAETQRSNILSKLASDYPELTNNNHELTKRAAELYNSMSDSEKQSPQSYYTAVYGAAAELGVRPVSRRSKEDHENFSLQGSSSLDGTSASRRGKGKKEGDLPEETLMWAQLLGRDVKDPKVVERLKSAASRGGSFSKFKPIKE